LTVTPGKPHPPSQIEMATIFQAAKQQKLITVLGNMSPAEYEKRYFERGNLSKKEIEVKLCA